MFTIEHTFDATVVTLIDEGDAPMKEDVVINAFEDCVTVNQFDARTNALCTVTLSLAQVRELQVALDLPEGIYQLRPPDGDARDD